MIKVKHSLRGRSTKSNREDAAVDALNLLMNDKIDQMISIDTLVSLLIQKGVFTKEEFDQVKQAIKGTDQYQKIYQLTDRIAESLDPALAHTRLTDKDIDDLVACLSESEISGNDVIST